METKAFRSRSLARLTEAGITIPTALPSIGDFSLRPADEILDRIICLNAVAAVAYGFSREHASAWLSREQLFANLTEDERLFISKGVGDADTFKIQVEGIWALSWIVGIVKEIDFWRECDPHFVTLLPNLKSAESSSGFRARARVRDNAAVGAEADLAYCLHWTIREADIHGAPVPAGITPYIVTQRRRAFDWAIGDSAWDEVSDDT
jgi:hypothetical protein